MEFPNIPGSHGRTDIHNKDYGCTAGRIYFLLLVIYRRCTGNYKADIENDAEDLHKNREGLSCPSVPAEVCTVPVAHVEGKSNAGQNLNMTEYVYNRNKEKKNECTWTFKFNH